MLDDVLATLKSMVVNYATASNEASSEFIYKEYMKQLQDLSIVAKELFNFAYEIEWVTLTEASSKDIKKEITKEKNILSGKE